jgi:hypothetical protein
LSYAHGPRTTFNNIVITNKGITNSIVITNKGITNSIVITNMVITSIVITNKGIINNMVITSIGIALYGSTCVVLHFTSHRQSLAANITHMHNPFFVSQIYREIHVFMQHFCDGPCIKNQSFLSKMERESQKKPRSHTHNFSPEEIVKLLEECSVERAVILSTGKYHMMDNTYNGRSVYR